MSTTPATADPDTAAAVERNLDLAQGYLLAMLENPAQAENVPDQTALVLLPQNDPKGFQANLEMGIALARKGRNVYFRHVQEDGRPLEQATSARNRPHRTFGD